MNESPRGFAANLRWSETFAALKHYNYRLWFIGQMVSLMGTWMQSTAQGYLIYQITLSPAYLGLVGFVSGVPTWLFTLFGGVVADRIPRRTLLIITQTSMMLLAFILAGLTFTHTVQPWHILVLAFLLGVANAFDAPARISFVIEMVPREDMTNAIALNSTMFNMATVVGPSIAGLTYAAFGPAWCFSLNGISFLAVIGALLLMKIQVSIHSLRKSPAMVDLLEGLRYTFRHRLILSLTGFIGMLGLLALGVLALLPVWATDVLHGDVTTNGLLISARGFGALVSALMVASFARLKLRGKLWTIGSFGMPVMLFVFALVRWLPLSLVVLVAVGWFYMMITTNSNTLIQSHVPDELRGRVMSVYSLIFNGSYPIGALLAGAVAQSLGAPVTVMLSAVLLLAFALAAWVFFPVIRAEG